MNTLRVVFRAYSFGHYNAYKPPGTLTVQKNVKRRKKPHDLKKKRSKIGIFLLYFVSYDMKLGTSTAFQLLY